MFGRVSLIATAALLLVPIAWITLGPQPIGNGGWLSFVREWFRGADGLLDLSAFLAVEFAANVALFVPLGLLLVALTGPRFWWLALSLAVAAALSIEYVQEFVPGRVSDSRDTVANAIGAAIGVGVGLTIMLISRRRLALDRRARARVPREPAPAA